MFKQSSNRIFRILALSAALAAAAPVMAHVTPEEAANKQVVLDFYTALNEADASGAMKDRIKAVAEKYLSPDYIQHSGMAASLPGPGTARDKLVRMFQSLPAMPGMPAPTTIAVIAEGNLVMMLTSRDMPNPASIGPKPSYTFNMFRVQNGMLVEHWDIAAASPMQMPTGMVGESNPGMPLGAPPPGADISPRQP